MRILLKFARFNGAIKGFAKELEELVEVDVDSDIKLTPMSTTTPTPTPTTMTPPTTPMPTLTTTPMPTLMTTPTTTPMSMPLLTPTLTPMTTMIPTPMPTLMPTTTSTTKTREKKTLLQLISERNYKLGSHFFFIEPPFAAEAETFHLIINKLQSSHGAFEKCLKNEITNLVCGAQNISGKVAGCKKISISHKVEEKKRVSIKAAEAVSMSEYRKLNRDRLILAANGIQTHD